MLTFESEQKALFIGKEQEGYFKGTPTLFVRGEVPLDKVLAALTEHEVKQLYLGAGFLSEPSTRYVNLVANSIPRSVVLTFETQQPESATSFLQTVSELPQVSSLILTLMMKGTYADKLVELVDLANKLSQSSKTSTVVQLKYDAHSCVSVHVGKDTYLSVYADYSEDKLLYSE
jgi:phosphohistidine phosphatase SixA